LVLIWIGYFDDGYTRNVSMCSIFVYLFFLINDWRLDSHLLNINLTCRSGHRANEDVHLIVRKSPVLDFCLSNSARKVVLGFYFSPSLSVGLCVFFIIAISDTVWLIWGFFFWVHRVLPLSLFLTGCVYFLIVSTYE